MGACKSRQSAKAAAAQKNEKLDTPLMTKSMEQKKGEFKLRPDAQPYVPFVPDDEPDVKEPWELFLDQKKRDLVAAQRGNLRRNRDGTYTAEYRNLLVRPAPGLRRPGRSPSPTRKDFDLRGAWRSAQKNVVPQQKPAEPAAKKRKPTALKKAILASREEPEKNELWAKFEAQLQKTKSAEKEKEETDTTELKVVKDDTEEPPRHVPFALAERCYVSDREDKSKAHRHVEESHALIREYVNNEITPELEEAVVETLFTLRQLRIQDMGMGQKSRRFAVGFREVSRLLTQKQVQCLVVAPDVERTGGAIEDKIAALVKSCEAQEVPVIFALSRRQLGMAIQKNVTVSVLAIQDVRGAVEQFSKMLDVATQVRA